MIQAILFDIDGVLLDSFEANLKFFQDLMIETGYPPPTREFYRPIFHINMRDAIKILTQLTSEEETQKIWELGRTTDKKHVELINMPDGAAETIKTLAQQYSLGLVTSRVRESVYNAPELAKLQTYFSVSIAYQDTVEHKPHPEPLLLAAQKLGVKPEACVYIGDVENDIVAARAANMKSIIYSPHHFPAADACTSSFIKLPTIIASL